MKNNLIKIGKTQAHWNVSGTRILKYSIDMYHKGLKEHKLITAPDLDILRNKARLQSERWIGKWEQLEQKRKIIEQREASIEEAEKRSNDAKKDLEEIEFLLIHTLSINDTVNWESLKKKNSFPEKKPIKPRPESYKKHAARPDRKTEIFNPSFTFFEKLFKSRKERKVLEYEKKYSDAISKWEKGTRSVDEINAKIDKRYQEQLKEYEKEVTTWEKRKTNFDRQQELFNRKIESLKQSYSSKEANAIVEYCEIVLNSSKYPDSFLKSFELEYNPENRILIVEYQLPPLEAFPKLREVKFIASKKELRESYISISQINKMFDESMYKITLRTIHELFEADSVDAIDAISFNGWVKAVNKATGKEENNCILTIQVRKDEFLEIDLSRVDPQICFRSLKGVASIRLSKLTPVQPILQLTRTDKRFVDGYDVVETVDKSTNLAAMNWEDFENLIRELFEKEFQANGGEVRVTQASRDGGVDAIAFDPDPIRGGKIVIQAKRYTNTVGVAAVRDLYGTVVNEGATKGILVTTANFGPDAYQFAKDKPLTLLSGSNLLHLLEKHGYHAKIDLREAKRILAEQEKEE